MSLAEQKLLIIDCQTTGMHPNLGQVLEIAWAVGNLQSGMRLQSHLIQLEDGKKIPNRVKEITGLKESDMDLAIPMEQARELFLRDIQGYDTALIHYAQFEKPFLAQFLAKENSPEALPFQVICTHLISKKLFPDVPSRNIRALSGYLGTHLSQVKRASEHVQATIEIWKALIPNLEAQGISGLARIPAWLATAPKKKTTRYEYRVGKEKRLALPEKPGVYRMLSKNGDILYVGKATCLRDRVNSYFRGKKNRDPRKLEMISQTWDLQFTECASAVEAALLESDEIKKYNPPYNVVLKSAGRIPIYYSRDFNTISSEPSLLCSRGPFRRMNSIEELKCVVDWLNGGSHARVFYDLLTEEQLILGYQIFKDRHFKQEIKNSNRSHLVLAYRLYRQWLKEEEIPEEPLEESAEVEEVIEVELTPEEVADKFERLYIRAAETLLRSQQIKSLLNSRIKWQENENWREIEVRHGRISSFENSEPVSEILTIADYDRMSILLSEMNSREHTIEYIDEP